MFTEKENTFLSKDTYPSTSGKFFGWVLRQLTTLAVDFIREVPIIGNRIAREIENNNAYQEWLNSKVVIYTPTEEEQAVLDNWMRKRFGPWIQVVANELSTALQSSNFNVQLAGMNKAMIQMCAIRQYCANNDKAGLSADAASVRNNTINTVFAPIENLITTTIETFPIQLSKVSVASNTLNKADFGSVIYNYSSFSHNYQCSKWVLPAGATVGNSIFAPSSTSIVPTANPVIEQLPTSAGTIPTTTIPPAVPGSTAPAGTPVLIPMTPTAGNGTTTTTTDNKEKNFLQKNAVPLALGAVALWALFSKKKKN